MSIFLRSSVLGGAVVMELIGSGGGAQNQQLFVYAGGSRIARERYGSVNFEQHNPVTGSFVVTHGHSSYRGN